ncbi:tRNA (5-methylaminomethyl-2-thiouridine)(34)-methyltransferase MnmD [Halpernia frigidisoli]|uniref:tRNA U34 5-methylaminomethyl-2-thiouridine-forming methyltransferase MnmC n=1 Tax=Halpernia frigidisoli TaxID=1125876 RepID=A0A1I3DCG2_9FLAO|nr:tRNA (5-methylaminomethyl-2-thiouridine)(34)-methyltransferase MnmD [Halpernia frigidisoli]SFH84414.1 tRNA U34 5-methylaminomethyl-2-thiouridine-forming methyltransferase MnmC [Halpernia frigidisoli]
MERDIIETNDGTKTLYIKDLNETYHSTHGALQEAKHVFIENGLKKVYYCDINILELGFGTGLNLLATIDEFLKTDKNHIVKYYTIEKYPISSTEIAELAYFKLFNEKKIEEIFKKIHNSEWNVKIELVPNFFFKKIKDDFHYLDQMELPPINLVYFDCFGARVQPDLWEIELLKKIKNKMADGGLLTTYSSKGSFRRALQELNFKVEKLKGPPGKREMINAVLGMGDFS